MNRSDIEALVLQCLRQANLARKPEAQLAVSADAAIFGAGSPLDSLGLVALLIDIEDGLAEAGLAISLSDAAAMSATRSPFRDVPALVDFIAGRVE